ncbi:MAG: FAD-dependent oxidoreductase [Myxococcales bacterium]|nr:NAD(P)/FAD-dependent oxidoreductase [Polyangiaceae bacterium]MDW8251674.1 FAD-dependent oxidoreductase [Myxococcales bacterium]
MARNDHDLVIVGGGPAGLSLALHLLHWTPRIRTRVVVLEKARYPREKYCAGAVGGRGEASLARIGVQIRVPSAPAHGISVRLPQGELAASPGAIGRVVRRIEYDHALARVAQERGIKIEEGTRVLGLQRDAEGVRVETDRGEIRASAVVGADGVGSVVRKGMGLGRGLWHAQVLEVDTPRTAQDPPRSMLHFDLSDPRFDGYFWDFPTVVEGEELVCRGVYRLVIPGRKPQDLEELLARYLERVGLDLRDSKKKRYAERGFAPQEPCWAPRILLIGEAAGVDPITGEGIAQALLYGEVAAKFLAERMARRDFSFVDWPDALASSPLGLDMRIRHEICARYFGPARAFYEEAFLEAPEAFSLGVDYFAGRPLRRLAQLSAGLRMAILAWRRRSLSPLRPWLNPA